MQYESVRESRWLTPIYADGYANKGFPAQELYNLSPVQLQFQDVISTTACYLWWYRQIVGGRGVYNATGLYFLLAIHSICGIHFHGKVSPSYADITHHHNAGPRISTTSKKVSQPAMFIDLYNRPPHDGRVASEENQTPHVCIYHQHSVVGRRKRSEASKDSTVHHPLSAIQALRPDLRDRNRERGKRHQSKILQFSFPVGLEHVFGAEEHDGSVMRAATCFFYANA